MKHKDKAISVLIAAAILALGARACSEIMEDQEQYRIEQKQRANRLYEEKHDHPEVQVNTY